jgi:hypothetical protein
VRRAAGHRPPAAFVYTTSAIRRGAGSSSSWAFKGTWRTRAFQHRVRLELAQVNTSFQLTAGDEFIASYHATIHLEPAELH